MADEAISEMPTVSALGGDELLPVVQALLNKKCTVNDLVKAFKLGLTVGALVYVGSDGPATDANIFRSGSGEVTLNLLKVLVGLTLPGPGNGVDSSGNITGATLHAQNGDNFSGAAATLTVVDGLVIAHT